MKFGGHTNIDDRRMSFNFGDYQTSDVSMATYFVKITISAISSEQIALETCNLADVCNL